MRKILTTALAGMALFATAAIAETEDDMGSGTITIQANVLEKCKWVNDTDTIEFDYDPLYGTGQDTQSALLEFDCVKGTDGTISWEAENGALEDEEGNTIGYDLTVYLNGTQISNNGTFTDENGPSEVGGDVEELQFDIDPEDNVNAPVGTYYETITVTISLQ